MSKTDVTRDFVAINCLMKDSKGLLVEFVAEISPMHVSSFYPAVLEDAHSKVTVTVLEVSVSKFYAVDDVPTIKSRIRSFMEMEEKEPDAPANLHFSDEESARLRALIETGAEPTEALKELLKSR